MQDPQDPANSGELPTAAQGPRAHPNDPLHGLTLKHILTQLYERYGWEQLGRFVQIRCFTHDPSMSSSLAFLRRHPWARAEVEELFLRSLKAPDGSAAELGADRKPASRWRK